ncbi:unnamed protein product [Diamesa serratosioi]
MSLNIPEVDPIKLLTTIENILEKSDKKKRVQTSLVGACGVCCWTFLSAVTFGSVGFLLGSISSGFVSFLLTKNSSEMNPYDMKPKQKFQFCLEAVRIYKDAGNKDLSKLITVLQTDQEFQDKLIKIIKNTTTL